VTQLDDSLGSLPARDLDQAELRRLAERIAARPELWRQHVAYDDEHRHYVSLHRDAHVDVWLLCWTPVNDTGWHDHDVSSGAVAVVRGCVTEHTLAIDRRHPGREVRAGRSFSFGPDHIHRMAGRDAGSVSVHVYSPPLWRMGQYTVGHGGGLARTSVSYADELRPLDGVALRT
jgi:hypothetical protein